MGHVHCPDCDGTIMLSSQVGLGQTLVCPYCDAEMEVIGTNPPEVIFSYDWEWEEEEEKVVW